jgi:uncharacterized protein YjbI with pentapeptide repeats
MSPARNASNNATPEPPLIEFVPLRDLNQVDPALLRARTTHEGELLDSDDLSDVDLSSTSFLECELRDLVLTDADLRGTRIVESLVVRPFATVLRAGRSTWRNSVIDTPRWGSAEAYDSDFHSVQFTGGKIDLLNLRDSRLTNVLFDGCVIGELDLSGVRANRVAFANCRIGTLDLTRATCTSVDLRSSEFAQFNGFDGLRGTTIDTQQLFAFAPRLATQFGIRVE